MSPAEWRLDEHPCPGSIEVKTLCAMLVVPLLIQLKAKYPLPTLKEKYPLKSQGDWKGSLTFFINFFKEDIPELKIGSLEHGYC